MRVCGRHSRRCISMVREKEEEEEEELEEEEVEMDPICCFMWGSGEDART